jgi:hypothetical protein
MPDVSWEDPMEEMKYFSGGMVGAALQFRLLHLTS